MPGAYHCSKKKKNKEKRTLGSSVSKRHNIIYSYSYKHPQRQLTSAMAKQQVQSAEVAQTGYSNTDSTLIFNNHSRWTIGFEREIK